MRPGRPRSSGGTEPRAPTVPPPGPIRGRGATFNPPNRFEEIHPEWDPDLEPEARPAPRTKFYLDASESILVHNDSPDVGFAWGLNPYRGCEHGCAYCYARPFHEYLGWSSGLDFETRILVKRRAPELLRAELAAPSWRPEVIGLSGVTDCYQPAERHFQLTRRCLEVLAECRHPVSVVTKNLLVTRDRDLLAELARHGAAAVALSVTTLDPVRAARLEPRAAAPAARLRAMRGGRLNDPEFGRRMRGEGVFAAQIRDLFRVAARREGLGRFGEVELSAAHFHRPGSAQRELF